MKRLSVCEREEGILSFWQDNKIFEKSEKGIPARGFIDVLRRKLFGRREFVFYDGPPFATGLPHFGHILASTIKDAIPRYKTMRGYRVKRRWGWDCHGLPLEVEIEKEIGAKNKKDIEGYGIEKFNEKARSAILRYAQEWKKIIPRIGRWVDMENDYRTVSTAYTESVWNTFHRLHTRGFVEEGHKALYLCPRCSTTLSNNEVTEGYTELADTAVFVLFPVKGMQDTSFIVWTTTPWTLFGNVALAINRDLMYVIAEKEGRRYILQEDTLPSFEGMTVLEKKRGVEFVGLSYEPLFAQLFENEACETRENIWKVYAADFVDASVGTGVVHVAPAYGSDDMDLARQENLPIKHHVTKDGEFVDDLGEPFAGCRPKEKGNPKDVETRILDAIDKKNHLFLSEEIVHSYPLCWRCETPLLNYATNSYFINVEKYRDAMLAENRKIGWVPEHLRDGRFGNWLENTKPWAVSRSRFWGAPLPVWKTEKGEKIVVGSIEEMIGRMKRRNRYVFVRHGQSTSNAKGRLHTKVEVKDPLTREGCRQADGVAEKIRRIDPTKLFASPFDRTQETARHIAKATGLPVVTDDLLVEVQAPALHGKKYADRDHVRDYVPTSEKEFFAAPVLKNGETFSDLYRRVLSFLEKMESQYENETIVVVSHKTVINCAKSIAPTFYGFCKNHVNAASRDLPNVSVEEISFVSLKRDENLDVDLHRPHIDSVVLYNERGEKAHHVGEVFDCWFESGSMPYGSNHYPFENLDVFDPKRLRRFPADFIAEGLDQTRGWFYSLLAVGVGAFGKSPYKNVIATGLIRAADGKKMSKKLKNYTDPLELVSQYGADALRHYLLLSPASQGQDLDFHNDGVNEIYKKVYARLHNCLNFYMTYASLPHDEKAGNPLDKYIRFRLAETRDAMTAGFESYHLSQAVQPIGGFVEDLSTWYLRRSRGVLREETENGAQARATLRFVLVEFAKLLAPVAPFYAEYLYQELLKHECGDNVSVRDGESGGAPFPQSVHLCHWPKKQAIRHGELEAMKLVRETVSAAHEIRARHGIKVRQPLATLTVNRDIKRDLQQLVADEVNVKTVMCDTAADSFVALDTELTRELKEEGLVRDLIRAVQQIRKEKNFTLTETAETLFLALPEEQKEVVARFEERVKKEVRVGSIIYRDENQETDIRK